LFGVRRRISWREAVQVSELWSDASADQKVLEGQVMEVVVVFFIIGMVIWICSPKSKPDRGHMPIVMHSDNGYEGHLDFLEMHGFVTAEEREEERRALQHYKDHPEEYVTMTLGELMKREGYKLEDKENGT